GPRTVASRPDGSGGNVRIPGPARADGRDSSGRYGQKRRSRRGHREGTGRRRQGGDRRPAPAGARQARRGQARAGGGSRGAPMNLAEIFIRRPVMTTLVMAAILLAGILGYRFLPVSDLPNVDFPTISVVAVLPGASPETMASSVATPLERQFSSIPGLDSMTSTNALGATQITLTFDLSRNLDA